MPQTCGIMPQVPSNPYATHTMTGNAPTDSPQPLVPAAQYVRMSTEHQQYSTSNQEDAIGEYAGRSRWPGRAWDTRLAVPPT